MESIVSSDNKLKSVKDKAVILQLLAGSKEGNFEIFIWKLIGNSKHLGQVRIEAIRKARNDFSIVPSEGQDRIVQELLGSQNFIDLYIPDSSILLRCNIKQTDAPFRYYLEIPEFVAQIDRRKDLRLDVSDESQVKVSFAMKVSQPKAMSQHFLKNCVDVSAGGFSFIVSKIESKFFTVGDQLPSIEIKAGNWSARIGLEIMTIKEVEPGQANNQVYKVWRIGCRISQIDQISRKYLEKFIFERIKDELRVINE